MCCAMILLLHSMIEEDQHGYISRAPLDMEYDNSSIKQSTVTALNIQHNPCISTPTP